MIQQTAERYLPTQSRAVSSCHIDRLYTHYQTVLTRCTSSSQAKWSLQPSWPVTRWACGQDLHMLHAMWQHKYNHAGGIKHTWSKCYLYNARTQHFAWVEPMYLTNMVWVDESRCAARLWDQTILLEWTGNLLPSHLPNMLSKLIVGWWLVYTTWRDYLTPPHPCGCVMAPTTPSTYCADHHLGGRSRLSLLSSVMFNL